MEAVWRNLCQRLHIADEDRLWTMIAAAYGEPHRHYHTLDHISATVAVFETVHDQFEAPDVALLALIFHDIVYDPARPDNEARSAGVLHDVLPQIDTTRARHHILATKHHRLDRDPDTNLVLDIDMSILGAPWPQYLVYARGVAREYLPVHGEQAYAAGRAAMFLTPALESERLFLTAPFSHLEGQARKNLAAERDLWRSGQFTAIQPV